MVGKLDKDPTADTEIMYLKFKNKELAKALTEEKLLTKQLLIERNYFQKKVHCLSVQNMRYEANIKKMVIQSQKMLPNVLALSKSIGDIMQISNDCTEISKSNLENLDRVTNQEAKAETVNKTHVVKPMVSGHIILRPTINLQRLTYSERNEYTNDVTEMHSNDSNEYVGDSIVLASDVFQDAPDTNIDILTMHQPINNLNFLSDDLSDSNELVPENLIENTETVAEGVKFRRLQTVYEEEDPVDYIETNYIQKEARVLIFPLPPSTVLSPNTHATREMNSTDTLQSNSSTSSQYKDSDISNYDPLEGPSTLLNYGYRNNRSFNRATYKSHSTIYTTESDSSDDEMNIELPISKKVIPQNNIFRKKKNASNQKNQTVTKIMEMNGKRKLKTTNSSENSHKKSGKSSQERYVKDKELQLQNGVLKRARVSIQQLPELLSNLPTTLINKTTVSEEQNDLSSGEYNTSTYDANDLQLTNLKITKQNAEIIDSSEDDMKAVDANEDKKKTIKRKYKEPVVLLTNIGLQEPKKSDSALKQEESKVKDENMSSSQSSSSDNDRVTERPKRFKFHGSLKEVSLRCKLRRE